jgi:dTDP-4-amino-4,6-dideoxygalactose transaminase
LVENKNEFIKEFIQQNIDLSPHYYRNCSNLEIFEKYTLKKLENLDNYVKSLIFFPTYQGVSEKYINNIINVFKSSNLNK